MSQLRIVQFEKPSQNYGINFCILLHDEKSQKTASIDAFEYDCIHAELGKYNWQLDTIFSTHKHLDHVNGNLPLKAKYNCKIIGPEKESQHIPGIDQTVKDGDLLDFAGHKLEVIGTPAHTMGQIAYYLPQQKILFAADALFSLGCGRLFEGTGEDLWRTMQRLSALPEETQIYCGHEYTLSNGEFALSVEPENQALQTRMKQVRQLRKNGQPTVPVTLRQELATNPFLRPHSEEIRENLKMPTASNAEVITKLRQMKDAF